MASGISSKSDATELMINKPMITTTITKSQPIHFSSNNKKNTSDLVIDHSSSLVEHHSGSFGHSYLSTSNGKAGNTVTQNKVDYFLASLDHTQLSYFNLLAVVLI